MKIELSLIIRICIEVKPGKMTGKESYYTFVCVCVCVYRYSKRLLAATAKGEYGKGNACLI